MNNQLCGGGGVVKIRNRLCHVKEMKQKNPSVLPGLSLVEA